jgi:hypothetical protein
VTEWETPDFEVTPLDELEDRRGFHDDADDPVSPGGADRSP